MIRDAFNFGKTYEFISPQEYQCLKVFQGCSYLSFWSPVWRCWAWPLAGALSLLTSSGSNWLDSAPLGSAGLRGSSSQRRCRLSVCGRRVGAWRRQVCVGTQAHGRGMGFSPDTTSHTHPQRAAEKEREREREVCFSRGCLLLAGETLQEFSGGMRMSLFLIGALSGCCPW